MTTVTCTYDSMSVVKSVWQNWETGLDLRARTDQAHCILGNITHEVYDTVVHVGTNTQSDDAVGHMMHMCLSSPSSSLHPVRLKPNRSFLHLPLHCVKNNCIQMDPLRMTQRAVVHTPGL